MQTIVIGHRNPDMDSICSAIAYARLKQLLGVPDVIAARAGNTNARRVESDSTTPSPDASGSAGSALGWGTRIRQVLLTGVSYMIPFVAAGGLLVDRRGGALLAQREPGEGATR